jgi:DNA-binding transcriptional LysR family regulator
MIEAFRAVIINGSISEAASFMNISQPAVSRLIKDLESEVGFLLLDRRNGRVFANDDGLTFFEEIRRSYIGLNRLEQAAYQIKNREANVLKIACLPVVGFSIMPNVIAKFIMVHPGIKINVQVTHSTAIIPLLKSLQCDIGFVERAYSSPSLTSGPEYHLDAVCILPVGHALTTLDIIKPQDLAGQAFISSGSDSKFRFEIDSVFEAEGVKRLLQIEATEMKMMGSLVAEGCGISIIDPLTALALSDQAIVIRPFQSTAQFSIRSYSSSQLAGTSLIYGFYEIFSEILANEQI